MIDKLSMKTYHSLLALFFLVSISTNGQNYFDHYKVTKYDSRNGMPTDFVLNTYQTKDGFIWMSTFDGYLRFDGKQFVNYNSNNTPQFKTDNNTSLFTESADSTLWLPTGAGLLCFKNGLFNSYLSEYPNLFLRGKTNSGELVLSSAELNTKKMVLVFNTLTHQYKKLTVSTESYLNLISNTGTAQKVEKDNWHITQNGIYHKSKEGTWKKITEKEGVQPNMLFSPDDIFVDHKNRVWLTSGYGIFLWDGNRFNIFPGMEKVIIVGANPSFGYMAEDKQGGIWTSFNNTLAYLPKNENRFRIFPKELLNIQTLHNISIDREQNIWVATDRGVIKISKTKVVNYAAAEGITNNRISSISEVFNNKFLITTPTEQLFWLENKTIKPFSSKNSSIFNSAFNFIANKTDSKGNTWLGHQQGLIKYNQSGAINIVTPNQVRFVEEGIDGKIYVAVAFTGIGVIEGESTLKMLSFPKVDFKTVYFSSLHQLKDSSFLATTYRTGAMIIDKKGNVKKLDLFNGVNGIAIFNAVELDNGDIWFATAKGLAKWVNGKITFIGTESGLTDASVFGILIDKKGEWWLPSNKGVIHAPFNEIEAYSNNKKTAVNWKIIDDADGMNNRQCVGARHSIVSKDGKIYVVGIGGLVVINPDSLSTNTVAPLVAISQLRVDDSLFFAKQTNTITPGNHRYIFDYSALSFVAPDKNQVYFRLEGQDKDWIRSTGDNLAIYTNLAPGKYRFEVKATNNDGVWSVTPAFIEFTVKAYFYQTIWFKVLTVIFLIGLIFAFVRWRTKAEREKNIWLEEQVKNRTKELQTSIDTLKSTQSQLVQSEKMASLGELTAGIAHEIQNPLNFVNNFSEVSNELIAELNEEKQKPTNERDTELEEDLLKDISTNLEKINHHGKRAADIVKSMLQHSRTSSGQKEPTDINALCDEYFKLSYHGLRAKDKSFNATLVTDLDPSNPIINIIPQDIGRVILNLINNAFYAVTTPQPPKGGEGKPSENYEPTVWVSTKLISPPSGGTGVRGRRVQIKVSDNGGGIPPSILEKIFQPFFTTKPTGQGTGLGLSLSYDMVKAHGGELKVATKEGEGTEFIIELPI